MKKFISYTSTLLGVLAIIFIPSFITLPEFSALFPHLTELYQSLESTALKIIPDEIEDIVSALNERLA